MKFFKSFYYAGSGIVAALGQRNFRFHICAAAFVIFFAARFYSFTAERWAILILACSAVLALEAVNTGIEKLADKVTEENSHRIKLAKDCAAGAVLITAISAVAVGVALFWNKDVLGLILLYFTEPARLAALILALAAAWGFVFLPEYWRNDNTKSKNYTNSVDKSQKMWYNNNVCFQNGGVVLKHKRKRKEVNGMKVTVDTIIGDILDFNGEAAAPIFLAMGMHCLGCPSARGESVGQACSVHGVDADDIVNKLNAALGE